jgi:hypothetical protein
MFQKGAICLEMLIRQLIKFKIELPPGTAPVATAPYKMSPAEMKELKIQLQVLLDIGNTLSGPFFVNFQDQAFKESQLFFIDQQGMSPCTCCTYEYSLYSVELEQHDRKV